MSFSPLFFEVTAQLIPVVFLAMVVDDQLRDPEDEGPFDRVTRSWWIVGLFVGELISLSVVAGGLEPSRSAGFVVSVVLLAAAFSIVVPVISREMTSDRGRGETLGHGLAALFAILVIIGVLVLLVAH